MSVLITVSVNELSLPTLPVLFGWERPVSIILLHCSGVNTGSPVVFAIYDFQLGSLIEWGWL